MGINWTHLTWFTESHFDQEKNFLTRHHYLLWKASLLSSIKGLTRILLDQLFKGEHHVNWTATPFIEQPSPPPKIEAFLFLSPQFMQTFPSHSLRFPRWVSLRIEQLNLQFCTYFFFSVHSPLLFFHHRCHVYPEVWQRRGPRKKGPSEVGGRAKSGAGRKQINTWNYHLCTYINTTRRSIVRHTK